MTTTELDFNFINKFLDKKSAFINADKYSTEIEKNNEIFLASREMILVLVALAKIDNDFCENEVNSIVCFAIREIENEGKIQSNEDVATFTNFIQHLSPSSDELRESLNKLNSLDMSTKEKFIRQCIAIMDSDNIRKNDELQFIIELQKNLNLGQI